MSDERLAADLWRAIGVLTEGKTCLDKAVEQLRERQETDAREISARLQSLSKTLADVERLLAAQAAADPPRLRPGDLYWRASVAIALVVLGVLSGSDSVVPAVLQLFGM